MPLVSAGRNRKAGLSGLLLVGVLLTANVAAAEPLMLEIAEATVGRHERSGEPLVSILFANNAKRTLAQFSSDHVGRKIELRVNNQVVISSVVREPILAGPMQVSGGFSVEQARDIAARLPPGTKVELEAAKD